MDKLSTKRRAGHGNELPQRSFRGLARAFREILRKREAVIATKKYLFRL
jgi:hypothetical protein